MDNGIDPVLNTAHPGKEAFIPALVFPSNAPLVRPASAGFPVVRKRGRSLRGAQSKRRRQRRRKSLPNDYQEPVRR